MITLCAHRISLYSSISPVLEVHVLADMYKAYNLSLCRLDDTSDRTDGPKERLPSPYSESAGSLQDSVTASMQQRTSQCAH